MGLKAKLIKLLGVADGTELDRRLSPAKSRVYKALIDQVGTADPTATVLHSDFSPSDVTLERVDIGMYRLHISGMKPKNTLVHFSVDSANAHMWYLHRDSGLGDAEVVLFTAASLADALGGVLSDDNMTDVSIEVEIFS